jgi:hypothetical protein
MTDLVAPAAKSKSKRKRLAEAILRDRAERAARKVRRTPAKVERVEFDPFKVARWRVVAGDDPGHLPHTKMQRGSTGWWIDCGCGEQFESRGARHCGKVRPKMMGRQCENPGCENRLSRYARANTRFCSNRCQKAARRALSLGADLSAETPPETLEKRASVIGPQDMPINVLGGHNPQPFPDVAVEFALPSGGWTEGVSSDGVVCQVWRRPTREVTLGASSRIEFQKSGPWSDDLDIPEFLRRAPKAAAS